MPPCLPAHVRNALIHKALGNALQNPAKQSMLPSLLEPQLDFLTAESGVAEDFSCSIWHMSSAAQAALPLPPI